MRQCVEGMHGWEGAGKKSAKGDDSDLLVRQVTGKKSCDGKSWDVWNWHAHLLYLRRDHRLRAT